MPGRSYSRRDPADRFWEKVDKQGGLPRYAPFLGDCWLWTAGRTNHGYGNFYVGSKAEGTWRSMPAHRWAYEAVHGEIPVGLECDHLCRVRACVNPTHLEAVTHQVNQLRGFSVVGLNSRQTHCPQGHPYDTVNTYRTPTNARICRICRRLHVHNYRRRRILARSETSR